MGGGVFRQHRRILFSALSRLCGANLPHFPLVSLSPSLSASFCLKFLAASLRCHAYEDVNVMRKGEEIGRMRCQGLAAGNEGLGWEWSMDKQNQRPIQGHVHEGGGEGGGALVSSAATCSFGVLPPPSPTSSPRSLSLSRSFSSCSSPQLVCCTSSLPSSPSIPACPLFCDAVEFDCLVSFFSMMILFCC